MELKQQQTNNMDETQRRRKKDSLRRNPSDLYSLTHG